MQPLSILDELDVCEVECPTCHVLIEIPRSQLGTTIKCRSCGRMTVAEAKQHELEDMASEWITAGVEQVWGEHEAALEQSVKEQQERLERRKTEQGRPFVLPSKRPEFPPGTQRPDVTISKSVTAPRPTTRAMHGIYSRSWAIAS